MADCTVHNKVYSGERFATNPPKWTWICEHCGELGRTEADEVYPRDFKRFARLMVHFYPNEKWWSRAAAE
jgi:hypothetical protein